VAGLIVVVAVLGLWMARARGQKDGQGGGDKAASGAAGAGAGRGAGKGGGADRVIPVLVTPVVVRDFPVYAEGLGTVTAYKTVNVHSQVEGRLETVAFREGQTVKRGELLAQIDSRPFSIQLHQAEAALARDRAQLHGAELNLTRYVTVSAERLIPQQQVDDQRALTEQLKGTVSADEAQIENARLQLAYARITSPIDGVTGIRQVDPGNVIHVADASGIVVITQIDPIAVIFTLPQDDLPQVVQSQADGPPPVEALSRDGDQLLGKGQLGLIDNQINQNTATLRLKAIFPNPAHTLWPNQFVKTRLRLSIKKGALVIAAAAIQRGPQGTFVYVVDNDDRAVMRPIELDVMEGEQAVVTKGVSPGERVVSEGQNQLRPGARVSLRAAGGGGGPAGRGAGQKSGGAGAKPGGPPAGGNPGSTGGPRAGGDHAGGTRPNTGGRPKQP
jgi:multidrug efflux system membrane fusion protein